MTQTNTLLPPKFCGTDGNDVRKWLRVFEEFAADAKWDDTTSASKVKLLLAGEAQLVVWDLDDTRQKSFAAIKIELTRVYGGESDSFKALNDFHSRTRGDSETLRELCFSLKLLHQKARPIDSVEHRDRDVRFKLLQLLKVDIRDTLLKSEDVETCSLETLLQRATRLEELAVRRPTSAANAVSNAATAAAAGDERLDRLERRLEDLIARVSVQSSSGNQRRRQQRGACFNCGRPGHFASQCTLREQKQNAIVCHKCSGRGHKASVCPSKNQGNF